MTGSLWEIHGGISFFLFLLSFSSPFVMTDILVAAAVFQTEDLKRQTFVTCNKTVRGSPVNVIYSLICTTVIEYSNVSEFHDKRR